MSSSPEHDDHLPKFGEGTLVTSPMRIHKQNGQWRSSPQ